MPRKTLTFDEFFKKAVKTHGNKYDYSIVRIVSSEEKIKIICPTHGVFNQTYGSHFSGNGCPGCSGNRKMSNEEFIKRSQEIHGVGTYEYNLIDLINCRKKVKIICSKHGHGIFEQVPYTHLVGVGCPKCRNEKLSTANTLSREEFIDKSKLVHGEEVFDYSLLEYVDSHTKAKFICKTHGVFEQIPNNNLCGAGCPMCSGNKKLTKKEFVDRAKKVHEDKYDYSKFVYKNNHTSSVIICLDHGKFYQDPSTHLFNGSGCPLCGKMLGSEKKRSNTEEFVKKAQKIHGREKFDYSKVQYTYAREKVSIKCNNCNREFKQMAENHLRGQGCPYCISSKGEQLIKEWLDRNNIKYIQEYGYKDLKGVNKRHSLKFDFYIIDMNMLIEFDGEQHFKPVCFGGISMIRARENFRILQINDAKKDKYCKDNNIALYRIRYKELKNIPEILYDIIGIENNIAA